jgi:hypothetical protein
MSFSQKTTKIIWGRAAGLCSMPDCRKSLFLDESETDDESLIGEMCHIVGESEDGPRGLHPMPVEQRNLSGNLILLCRNHHREIDTQPGTWPIERLHQIKEAHQRWVRESLPGFDKQKQRDDETYAAYVDEWVRLCNVDRWMEWSSWVFGGGQPSLSKAMDRNLEEFRGWLIRRIWPERYPGLERAFRNFFAVAAAFQETFRKHASSPFPDSDDLVTEKFYKISPWDPPRYSQLFEQFEFHVDLVQDLMLELTRAANHLCDVIRSMLNSGFMLKEGRLAVMSGPHMDLSYHQDIVRYSADECEREPIPFPGLTQFLIVRADRDMHYGSGPAPI